MCQVQVCEECSGAGYGIGLALVGSGLIYCYWEQALPTLHLWFVCFFVCIWAEFYTPRLKFNPNFLFDTCTSQASIIKFMFCPWALASIISVFSLSSSLFFLSPRVTFLQEAVVLWSQFTKILGFHLQKIYPTPCYIWTDKWGIFNYYFWVDGVDFWRHVHHKFPLMLMGGQAKGQPCADTGARTPSSPVEMLPSSALAEVSCIIPA